MFHIIPGHSRNIVLFYPIQKFASVLNAFLIETLEGGAIPFQGVHPGNVVGGEKEQPPLLFIVPGQLYGLVIALCPQPELLGSDGVTPPNEIGQHPVLARFAGDGGGLG